MKFKKNTHTIQPIAVKRIERLIHLVRGRRIILASDLAELYGVLTWRLNEQVKRNENRFPEDFVFQLTREEDQFLTSQIARSKKVRGGRRTLPYAFSEHGAIMAAMILNSHRAVEMSVHVVRVFVHLREIMANNRELTQKLDELERKLEGHDHAIQNIFETIRQLLNSPEPKRPQIGFYVTK